MSSFHRVCVLPTTSMSFQDLSGSPPSLLPFPAFPSRSLGEGQPRYSWHWPWGCGQQGWVVVLMLPSLLGQGWEQKIWVFPS